MTRQILVTSALPRLTRDHGAALHQRSHDPTHGTARERGVPDQARREGLPGEQARQEPHGGARVAAVNLGIRRCKPVESNPVHSKRSASVVFDAHAHLSEGALRGDVVFAVGKAPQLRAAVGDGRHDQRTVTDALVRRHRHAAAEGPSERLNDQARHSRGSHFFESPGPPLRPGDCMAGTTLG